MEFFTPTVKDVSLYREIVKNMINPLEVIREAISNSIDAEAKNIVIRVYRAEDGRFSLVIEDDGIGMDESDLQSFFNLGDSKKDLKNIGEKGLGTKIFFRCDELSISTCKQGHNKIVSYMKKPWNRLEDGMLPNYTIEIKDDKAKIIGTSIKIDNYLINNPEKTFNFHVIKDYILWFTAAGSFKNIFANYVELNNYIKNIQVAPRVFIKDEILGIEEEIAGAHQFSEPQENPKPDIKEKVYKRSVNYCRHFGPYHRSTNIEGEYVSFQLYGTISGINCRKDISKMRRSERYKSRFGIYLAKDFIPVAKTNLISSNNFHHFHLLLNSQNFDLTADRNNICNRDSVKIKWIFDNAKKIINEDILPLAENGYFKMRKEEEITYLINTKNDNLNIRLDTYKEIQDIDISDIALKKIPDNEAQTTLMFAILLSNPKYSVFIRYILNILHYANNSTTDLICSDKNGKVVLVEVEFLLSNIFKHHHPFKTFDYIVCWKVDIKEKSKKFLVDNIELKLCFENEEYYLKYLDINRIYIIELSEVLRKITNKNLKK